MSAEGATVVTEPYTDVTRCKLVLSRPGPAQKMPVPSVRDLLQFSLGSTVSTARVH
jgi:hypothetical protein